MNTRLQTSVDSLSIIDGVWQERASNVGIIEHSPVVPSKHGRGNVYVLVETVGSFPDPAKIQQQIIRIVQECYSTPGSVTASMRLAIKAANTYLFEENLNAPREERGIAGVTCVVLKDRDAYLGQCGPAVLYHVGKGQFQRLPPESTWLTSKTLQDVDVGKQPPIGLRRDIEPELSHVHVREGDVLILASTSLAKLASDEEIASATLHRGAYTIRGNLESLAQGEDFSVVTIEVLTTDQASMQVEAEESRTPSIPLRPPSLWVRASSAFRKRFLPSPEAEEESEKDLEEAPAPQFLEEEEEAEGFLPSIDLREAAESARRALTKVGRGLGAILVRVLPETEPGQHKRQSRARAIGRREQDASRKEAQRATQMDRRWLWATLLIPVVVVLLFVITRFQYQRSQQAQFQRLVQRIEEAKTAAEASPVVAEQRVRLAEALTLLDEALETKPEDEQLLAEREATLAWLDRVNQVSRIFYFSELQEFADTESAESHLRKVLVHDIDVYVLDLGTNRVYKSLLNDARDGLQILEGDQVLLRKGDQRGETIVDDLLDIAWVEAGGLRGTSNLLILDKKGHVLQYDPLLGLQLLPSADHSSWSEPVAAAGYYGRFYLLDPKANQVLRYILTNNGYDGPPGNYFQAETSADASNAVDIAIDGNVYTLHMDGTISKYQQGVGVPFPQNNLDEPLSNPSSIFATGFMDEGGYIYVVDTGNQRIVQFSKAGEFVRQFRGRDPTYMNDLRSVFVDEAGKKLFLLDGSKLYLAHLSE